MSIPTLNITIWTDASKTGWGGGVSSLGSTISGVWFHEESLLHINTLECLAVTCSLLKPNPPKDSVLLVRTDNTVVVSPINKQGSNKSKVLSRFLHELLALCARNKWTFRSRHLPGHLNTWADSLSRSHPVRAEWSLSPQSFQQLKSTPHSGDRPLRSPGKRQAAGLRMPIPVPLSHSGGRPSHELEQVEEDLSLPPSRPDPSLPAKTTRLRRFRAGHRSSTSFRSLGARVPSRSHPTRRRPRHRAMGARRMPKAREKTSYLFRAFRFSRTSTP